MCCFVRDGGNGLLYASGGCGRMPADVLRGTDPPPPLPILARTTGGCCCKYRPGGFLSMFKKKKISFSLLSCDFLLLLLVTPPEELMSRCSVILQKQLHFQTVLQQVKLLIGLFVSRFCLQEIRYNSRLQSFLGLVVNPLF